MKKTRWLIALLIILSVIFAFTACSKAEPKEEPNEEAAEASEDDAEEATDEKSTEADGDDIELANPWSDIDSLQAACEGAGVAFDLADGIETSLGKIESCTYRYMDGLVEVDTSLSDVELLIRKGIAPEDGDVSGDYNNYTYQWTQNVNDIEVTCFGNSENVATKAIWTIEDMAYAVSAYGMGEGDFGLSADDLSTLINNMK